MGMINSKIPYGVKFYLIADYKTLCVNDRKFLIRHVIRNKKSIFYAEELGEYGQVCRTWGAFDNPRQALNRIKGLADKGIRPYFIHTGHSSVGILNSYTGQVALDVKEGN